MAKLKRKFDVRWCDPSIERAGRRFVGLCPFHSENSPSFSVNPEMGLYYCFGCQESGDAITFVRKLDGLDFPEAVDHLAVDGQ